ncbi:MAG: outer membrane lipoprotein-sorting protein [Spirochaetales bacterium]|nr:outer membrane lipoprotein-sorting protein [Spirochaetales bacterium]
MRKLVSFIMWGFLCLSLFAQTSTDVARLRRADGSWTYVDSDFSAEYEIIQDTPGRGRSITKAAVFRRDRNNIYTIVVLEPQADRGQGYLKQGDTLWIYDPESGQFNTTSSRDRFRNTNARNSDFTQSTLAEDYRILSVSSVRLGRFDAFLYELESDKSGITFPYMKVWITDDGRILKTEDYSLSRQLMRTTAVPNYHQISGRLVPQQIFIVDELEGAVVNGTFVHERTILTVSNPSFAPVNDSVFSRTFLERIRR